MRRFVTYAAITVLSASMLCGATVVRADAVSDDTYLALGADLKSSEKAEVLKLLGVDEDELDEYNVITVTNQDEHDYLDSYLSSSIIGSRALSSVLVEKTDEGSGINVSTQNITYCTPAMYQNALTTAGVTDADVKVAGPFEITGTAALVGVMKAYGDLTGDDISKDSADAATQELVVTGDIADSIDDSDKATEFIAMIKEEVLSDDATSEENIDSIIDEVSKELDVEVTDDQKEQIVELMQKIDDLDLDVDQLKKQASEIYDKLSNLDIDVEETKGFFSGIISALQSFLSSIQGLLQ